MRLDTTAVGVPTSQVPAHAGEHQRRGTHGWFATETTGDPFLACALAAQASDTMRIGTGIAVAFARNPMDVAYSANDLQLLSGGRFTLGLGTQVRAHIERRYSMPWSRPAARMREFILALRAIWAAWEDETRLAFEGEFYQHTLMTPFFAGLRHEHGPPEVGLAAVGPGMCRVAGEVADLVLANPFNTPDYLRQVVRPAVAEGIAAAGRDPADVDLHLGVFVVTGQDVDERAEVTTRVRERLAFYASTPAYRRVLELHDLLPLHEDLAGMARAGEWRSMGERIDDEVLDLLALVVDHPDDVGRAIVARFGDLADRVYLYPTWEPDAAQQQRIQADLAAHQGGGSTWS